MRRTIFIYLIYWHLLCARANVEFILYSLHNPNWAQNGQQLFLVAFNQARLARCRSHPQIENDSIRLNIHLIKAVRLCNALMQYDIDLAAR